MSAETPPAAGHDPYAALRFPDFRRLLGGGFLITSALLIQYVVLGYELYRITRNPLMLGLVGLAEAIPFMGLALFGGYVADRYSKVRVMQRAAAALVLSSLVLVWATLPESRARIGQTGMLVAIYSSIFVIGLARGFYAPAASALRAFLVPRAVFPNAASWASSFWQAGAVLGPLAGGLLYAALGLTATLLLVVGLMLANLLLIGRIQPPPVVAEAAQGGVWHSLREGLRYVWRTKVILYALSLDMFSVLFGGVVALLPIFAEDLLKVGPEGLGLLRAAPALGALLTVLACAWIPPTRRPWRNLLAAVTGFGAATLVFGLSDHFLLSLLALFLTGAFDSISVVIRNTLLQVMTEDAMRGRVFAVNSVFVSASNELGAFQSGVSASLLGPVRAVLAGAGITFVVVFLVARRSRDLLQVRLH
ncbi:MAG TPA: MFS transporter [Nevskiaceae bacterium]|nr:MFS transporter [Nevskiaceae bacterium]